jgi:3-oxoacyl-[acyl-carrier protein] reductase
MDTLKGSRVLVVGGGGDGIGRAITRGVARAGGRIAVADVDADRAEAAAAEVAGVGADAFAVVGDVRSIDDVERMPAEAIRCLGGLDVLITVVGGQTSFAPRGKVGDTTDATWDLIVDLNLTSVFRLTRAALRAFTSQGTGGSIVAVGSIAGVTGCFEMAPYGASKAGLNNLAATVALEYGAEGIRMNVVSPGPVVTAASAAILTEERSKPLPAQRFGTPDEIAEAVVFAASPLASYMNGHNLIVDGAATRHQVAFALR